MQMELNGKDIEVMVDVLSLADGEFREPAQRQALARFTKQLIPHMHEESVVGLLDEAVRRDDYDMYVLLLTQRPEVLQAGDPNSKDAPCAAWLLHAGISAWLDEDKRFLEFLVPICKQQAGDLQKFKAVREAWKEGYTLAHDHSTLASLPWLRGALDYIKDVSPAPRGKALVKYLKETYGEQIEDFTLLTQVVREASLEPDPEEEAMELGVDLA